MSQQLNYRSADPEPSQETISRVAGTLILIGFSLQTLMLAFQWYEVSRFNAEIARYMPDIGNPNKSNSVQFMYEYGAINIPFLAQFLLVPAIVFCGMWWRRRYWFWILLAAFVMGCFCWSLAAVASGKWIEYYD